MTTQRDRLAEVIHEEVWDRSSTHSSSCVNCKADADKLIRRGVRLLDAETAELLRWAVETAVFDADDGGPADTRALRARLLTVLDAAGRS